MHDQSIHPRVVDGKTVGTKVNTSRKRQKGTTERSIAAIEKHLENHPTDGLSRRHLDLLKGRL